MFKLRNGYFRLEIFFLFQKFNFYKNPLVYFLLFSVLSFLKFLKNLNSLFFKVNQLTYNQTCNSSNQCNYVVSGLTCSNSLSTCQCSNSVNYFKASTSLCGNLNFQCDILLYNAIIKIVFKNIN